jgi:H+/Cl- antiporter ClcA
MKKFNYSFEQIKIGKGLLYYSLLVIPIAVAIGSIVALFLWLLDWATALRWQYMSLIFLLPLAGVFIHFVYKSVGKNSERGNNLVIDEIHKPGGGVPARMTPLILFATIVTHLFGGSAGREGTAVQMGGSISSLFCKWYRSKHEQKRILLMAGMAAGFGAVFGTPVTGAIFALEVLTIGRIRYDALLPCFVASLVAHITCTALGIQHTAYSITSIANKPYWLPYFSFDFLLIGKVIIAGILFGLTGFLFAQLSRFIKSTAARYIKIDWVIPIIGAALVIGISYAIGNFDYLGLGVTHPANGVSIVNAFKPGGAHTWSWLWKLLLTAITLSTGFKGGEVTPLFFIGATLGNVLASFSGAPIDLFAGLGFIAVFAGATNTPLACTLMGVELFGGEHLIYYATACFLAYYFSGHAGIYSAQKVEVDKRIWYKK